MGWLPIQSRGVFSYYASRKMLPVSGNRHLQENCHISHPNMYEQTRLTSNKAVIVIGPNQGTFHCGFSIIHYQGGKYPIWASQSWSGLKWGKTKIIVFLRHIQQEILWENEKFCSQTLEISIEEDVKTYNIICLQSRIRCRAVYNTLLVGRRLLLGILQS